MPYDSFLRTPLVGGKLADVLMSSQHNRRTSRVCALAVQHQRLAIRGYLYGAACLVLKGRPHAHDHLHTLCAASRKHRLASRQLNTECQLVIYLQKNSRRWPHRTKDKLLHPDTAVASTPPGLESQGVSALHMTSSRSTCLP